MFLFWLFIIGYFVVLISFILFYIYAHCVQKSGTQDINESLAKKGFTISKKLNLGNNWQFNIDTEKNLIAIGTTYPNTKLTFFDFSQIIDCRIIENSKVVTGGGVGRAIAGGIIAGGVGAIVGVNSKKNKNIINNLSIDIITTNLENSVFTMKIIDCPIDINQNQLFYNQAIRFANDVYATVQSIINNNVSRKEEMQIDSSNTLEELEKLSTLREKGIITEDEFLESKKKILSKL